MRTQSTLGLSLTRFVMLLAVTTGPLLLANEGDQVEFNRDIRPILSDKCFACHGADAQTREADLRLDTFSGATNSGSSGKAIVPGDPDASEMLQRILSDDPDLKMPPANAHKELSSEEIEILKTWIRQGATYQQHWSFEPIQSPEIPSAISPHFVRNPIDAFIQERLSSAGLTPAAEADRPTLLRRVAFALTGLPPTLEEQELYYNDQSATAYEAMVERYLQSARYGEEMARHWLDVARYADTHGMHLDNERQTWAYRDWVVNAFNRNLPFDQFTIEQLAGDLLPSPTQDQLVATGFNRCNVTSSEGGSINEELLYRYAVDRTSTTMQTWLGLTGGCAVCHDHKFDPISQREFYSMYAFFNSAADPAMDGNALLTQPVLRLESDESRSQLSDLDAQVAQVIAERTQLANSITYVDPATLEPRPEPIHSESLWMDDDFPSDGKLTAAGAPLAFTDTTEALPAVSGSKFITRKADGLAQDVWESTTAPLLIPTGGKIFASVYLAADNPPRSIMLQFNREGWNHRAVWGDYEAIDWGAINTHQRVHMGPLPELGKWVTLEVPSETVGLNPDDRLVGFALTQHGGTVHWDRVGVAGMIDKANDPRHSYDVWWKQTVAQEAGQVAEEIRSAVQQLKKAQEAGEPQDENTIALVRAYYFAKVCQETKPQFDLFDQRLAAITNQRKQIEDALPSTFIYRDLPTPRESFVMMRGAYDKPGEKVTPNVLEILPPLQLSDPAAIPSRLDLANWLVAPEQPLTARVTVNRFWQQMFGTGLVKSSYDFGTQGELPSHPQLLDWLAQYYQQNGWDTKQLIRLFITSHTFRQASHITPRHLELDPENRLYARGPRFRLDAEPIRDNALFVAGMLDLTMGGKGVKPYQPDNIWEPVGFAGSNTRFYSRDAGQALYRRSLYTFYKRTAPPPFMSNFDAPNREQFCTRRERSNTPLQALQLMNDVQHVEAARGLAQRLITSEAELTARIELAFRYVLCRQPSDVEVNILMEQYSTHLTRYQQDIESAKKVIEFGESDPLPGCEPAELASLTMVCNTLLNLDETLTRN